VVRLDTDEFQAKRDRVTRLCGELLDNIDQISKVLVSTLEDTANNWSCVWLVEGGRALNQHMH
jgi:hypothetical protein